MNNDLTPAITDATNALLDTVLALALNGPGLTSSFTGMRDGAEDAIRQALALQELLELQTQGGGPAADGYTPADAKAVDAGVRAHAFAQIAERATVTVDGTTYLRGLGPVATAA